MEQHFNVDALNQLSTSTRAGFVNNYMGGFAAAAPSSMVLNGFLGPTIYSDNAFAQGGLALTNGPQSFSLVATDASGRTATDSMTQTYPTNVAFAYDDNGNMTSDGRLGYAYDDENQLIRIMATNAWKSEFTYDGRMRMRIRKEYNWQSSAWIRTNEVHYIYDGMLVIQERDANNVSRVSYTRGNDLSGTLEGAGGIGGLLARTDNAQLRAGIYSANAYYHCDGNGNITMLVNAFQFPVAKYNYDPYGNCTAYAGPLAEANVYRFSSKEFHAQSGLSYYGYRFYSPVLQKWLNADPIQEKGGYNLYGFAQNRPTILLDRLGLDIPSYPYWPPPIPPSAPYLPPIPKPPTPTPPPRGWDQNDILACQLRCDEFCSGPGIPDPALCAQNCYLNCDVNPFAPPSPIPPAPRIRPSPPNTQSIPSLLKEVCKGIWKWHKSGSGAKEGH